MIAYGSELAERTPNPVLRAAVRLLGSYDLGARVRFAAVSRALRSLSPPAEALDVGCGLGSLCFAMHRLWPDAKILGIDIDRDRLDAAHEMAFQRGVSRSVTFAHVTEQDAQHDVVTCVDVLEHVEDDAGFIDKLFAATKPGGSLVLHVPAATKKRYLAEFPEQPDHVRPGYSRDALIALLLRSGFVEPQLSFTFGYLGALGWEGCALARQGLLIPRILLPLWYACAIFDSLRKPRHGNGILVIAKRSEAHCKEL